jgi:hypothetical protein
MLPSFGSCKLEGIVMEDYIIPDDKIPGTITEDTS